MRWIALTLALMTAQAVADPCNCQVVDRGKPQRHLALWVAAGGGGLLATSFALSLYEKKQWDAQQPAAQMGDMRAIDASNRAHDITKVYGTGLFALGTIGLGVATFLYLTAPDREVVIAPTVAPGQGGLSLAGRF